MTGVQNQELSDKIEKNYTQCPLCGSSDMDSDESEGRLVLSMPVKCNKCKSTWVEHFRFFSASDFVQGDTS